MMREKEDCGEGHAKIKVNFTILRDYLEIPKPFYTSFFYIYFLFFCEEDFKMEFGSVKGLQRK